MSPNQLPLALAFVLSPFLVLAADGQQPAQAAPQATPPTPQATAPTLIIKGGRLFDSETATARALGQLWVAGDKILGEKPAATPIPSGVRVIDGEGCTILPGFFDLHVHVAVPGGPMIGGAMLPSEEHLATHAAFGVLHVVDLHHDAATVFALREKSNKEPGLARLLAAGGAFTAPGGHGTQFGIEANVVTKPEEVAARFLKLLAFKPDVVKAIVEHGGWAGLPAMPTLDEPIVTEVAKHAHAAGLPLFVHAWSLDEAKLAVRAGADVLAHGVYLGAVDDELIKLMKEHSTAYVPTLAVVLGPRRIKAGKTPYTKEHLSDLIEPELAAALADPESTAWAADWNADEKVFLSNLSRIHGAGVRVGTGTDAGNPLTPHGPALLEEIGLYVEAGLTPAQALQCATLESARILRRDKEFGSLAATRTADLVIVRGDPLTQLDDLWKIEHVVRAGAEVDRDALRRRNKERAAAPAPSVTALKVGAGVAPTVDDFDDGDLHCAWGGDWTVTTDEVAPGGKSKATAAVVEGESSGHLLLKGTLASGFQYGPFAGIHVQWDPQARTLVDASGVKDVVLRVRGSPRSYALTVERAAVKDYNVFSAPFAATDEWQELRVPLASFKQIGYGRSVPTSWFDVKGLTLQARVAPGATDVGEFELEIDWIRME